MALIFGSLALDIVGVLAAITVSLYFYFSRHFDFWEKLGIPYVKPLPFVGTLKDVIFQKSSIGQYLMKVYDEHKDKPYVGIFAFDRPALVVRDLELVKKVLVKDSNVFLDRLASAEEDTDPLIHNGLFALKGQKWRNLRIKLTPTFTSGKMKNMFHLVNSCAKELVSNLDKATAKGSTVEVKDTMARFTTDVIATCAFGIESNSLKNPDAEFRRILSRVFSFSVIKSFAGLLAFFAPQLQKMLRLKIVDNSVNDFVRNTVWSTVEYREKNGIVRKDFLDNMIELRKKSKEDDVGTNESPIKVDGDVFIAQSFSFLTAGFETSSTTMSYALYELAFHPDAQSRLRNEINQVLSKHNQEVTYEAIHEMKYLDMVVSETMRKYPILPFLDRNTLRDYEIATPDGSKTFKLPAGTAVYIPLVAIQHDSEYYPEPEKFDPERFTDENKQTRPQYTYFPFGEGPRICIGMRFGLMQMKAGLTHILRSYDVTPSKETPVPLVFDKKSFLFHVKGAMSLKFNKIK